MPRRPETWVSLCNLMLKHRGFSRSSAILGSDSLSTTICDTPRIYPSLSEYTPSPFLTTMCDIPRIYPSVTEYSPFSKTTCICEIIYHSLPELTNILGRRSRFWECCMYFFKGRSVFWEGGIDTGSVAYIC